MLATDTGAVRRRAGGHGRHRGAVPGRGRDRAGRGRLRPAARGGRPERRADGRGPAVPGAGTNVVGATATPPSWTRTCSTAARSSSAGRSSTSGWRPAPMETRSAAAAWGEDGRLTAWIPNQGAQGTRDSLARRARRRIRPGPGDHPGRRRGVRREVRRRPGSTSVVAWVARSSSAGRPGGSETRYENLLGMTHGRAQQQTVTIGGQPGRHRAGLPARDRAGLWGLPEDRRLLPMLTDPDGPRAIRDPGRGGRRARRWSLTPPRSAPTVARAGPRRRPRSSGPWTCSPPRSAMDPAEVRRRNLLPAVHRAAPDQVRRAVRHRRLRGRAGQGAGGGGLRRRCARSRRSGGTAATWCSWASGWPATSRSPAAATSQARPGERHRRGAPGRHGHDPDRHLAARPGPRDRVGHAGQRGTRHPGRQDHAEVGRHRPDPRGRRHRRLAQPAAGRRRGPAGVPGTDRGGPGTGRRRARGQRRRPGLRRGTERVHGGRRPGPRWSR